MTDVPAPDYGELIERLRERYTADPVPPCRVCGEPLSIQRAGGGEPTIWGCSPYESDPENPGMNRMKEGRDVRGDDHYGQSRWTQYREGDSDVLAAADALSELQGRVERMGEALEPFAKVLAHRREFYAQRHTDKEIGERNFDNMPDNWPMDCTFSMGHFRRARSALTGRTRS